MAEKKNFTTPVGRLVAGSLYTPQTTDAEGKPKVYTSGPKTGQPKVDYYAGLAIPKGTERHWAETSWGATIWQVGHTAFPQAAQSPAFAWKVADGDSIIPNGKGRKNCEREGYPGHWVLTLTSTYPPKIYVKQGDALPVEVTQVDYIKPGYYIQAVIVPDGNGSDLKPGVKLYYSMVCLRGGGKEISFGPDVASAGFGAAPLPAGAEAVPTLNTFPTPGIPGVPAPPAIPGAYVAAPTPAPVAPPAPTVPAAPIVPKPEFLQVPPPNPQQAQVPQIPVAPAPVPSTTASVAPSSGPKMTALAGGNSYQAYIQGGWSDAQLIQAGYMTL